MTSTRLPPPFTFSLTTSPGAWRSLPIILDLIPNDWCLELIKPTWLPTDTYPLMPPVVGLDAAITAVRIMMAGFQLLQNPRLSPTGANDAHAAQQGKTSSDIPEVDMLNASAAPSNNRNSATLGCPTYKNIVGRMLPSHQEARAVALAFLMESLGWEVGWADALLSEILRSSSGSPGATAADYTGATSTSTNISILLLDDLSTLPTDNTEILLAVALAHQGISGQYTHVISVLPSHNPLYILDQIRQCLVHAAPPVPDNFHFRPVLSPMVLLVTGLVGSGKTALCQATAAHFGTSVTKYFPNELLTDARGPHRPVEIIKQLGSFFQWHQDIKIVALDSTEDESTVRDLVRLMGNGPDDTTRSTSRLMVVYLDTSLEHRMGRAAAAGTPFAVANDYPALIAGVQNISKLADVVAKNNGALEDVCKMVWERLAPRDRM